MRSFTFVLATVVVSCFIIQTSCYSSQRSSQSTSEQEEYNPVTYETPQNNNNGNNGFINANNGNNGFINANNGNNGMSTPDPATTNLDTESTTDFGPESINDPEPTTASTVEIEFDDEDNNNNHSHHHNGHHGNHHNGHNGNHHNGHNGNNHHGQQDSDEEATTKNVILPLRIEATPSAPVGVHNPTQPQSQTLAPISTPYIAPSTTTTGNSSIGNYSDFGNFTLDEGGYNNSNESFIEIELF
jgi:hypothetical protein